MISGRINYHLAVICFLLSLTWHLATVNLQTRVVAPGPPKENVKEKNSSEAEKKSEVIADQKETSLNAAPEPQIADKKEKETAKENQVAEENQIPLIIKDEVAKDLILPERDAELLELEMRARAIRSLLKAKSQAANEDETTSKND